MLWYRVYTPRFPLPVDVDLDGWRQCLTLKVCPADTTAMNAYWDKVTEEIKYEVLDVVDKKTVGLYGRSYTKLNILDGMVRVTVHDWTLRIEQEFGLHGHWGQANRGQTRIPY
jgi:hypothetical protein